MAGVSLLLLMLAPQLAITQFSHVSSPMDDTLLQLSDILPKDAKSYDKMRPPSSDGSPTVVYFHVTVMSLDSIDEGSMTYAADIFFGQSWKDPRLRFPNMTGIYRLLPVSWLKEIWRPDSFFKNAKSVTFQKMTIPNHYVWLYHDSTILYMVKLTLLLSCAMTFHAYPHDTQKCAMKIESLSHTTADLVFTWEPEVPLEVDESIELPQLDLVSNTTGDCTQVYSTGNFTCLEVAFTFKRRLGYYLFHTYVPTCLIVIMSWISFWIKPEAVPARVTLGVTSLLTLSTQHANSQKSLPPVSYIKAIDMFMSSCTVFVFLSLMEYAVVNVILGDMVERRSQESLMNKISKKLARKKAKSKRNSDQNRADHPTEFCPCCCCQECHDFVPDSSAAGQHDSIVIDPSPTPLGRRDEPRRGTEASVIVALPSITEAALQHKISTPKTELDGPATVRHAPQRPSTTILRSNFPRDLHHDLHSRALQGGSQQEPRQCLHACPTTKARHDLQKTKQESQSSIPSLNFYQNLQSNGNGSTSNLSRTFLLEMKDARAKAILVDRFSRVFFPLSFAILNILYWYVYFEW